MKKIAPFIYYLFNITEQESIATKPDGKFFKRKCKKILLEMENFCTRDSLPRIFISSKSTLVIFSCYLFYPTPIKLFHLNLPRIKNSTTPYDSDPLATPFYHTLYKPKLLLLPLLLLRSFTTVLSTPTTIISTTTSTTPLIISPTTTTTSPYSYSTTTPTTITTTTFPTTTPLLLLFLPTTTYYPSP